MKNTSRILGLLLLFALLNGCASTSETAPPNSEIGGNHLLPRPMDVVSNLQDLCDFVDYGIFNHWDFVTVTLQNYPIEDLDLELAKVYWTAQLVDINPMISGRLFEDQLTIYFDYRPDIVLLTAGDEDWYVHGRDVSYVPLVSSRDETFTDFPYRHYEVGVEVATSDQLWYCLDQGYRPLPTPGSKAEIYLAQCENILRTIVDDTMSAEEKVRAIYEWESYTLTYDFDASSISTTDAIAATYDAFYLEGVLDNERGVCDAFAKLFTLLVNMEGIPCKRVLGPSWYEYANPVIGSVGHAWNLVQIDGTWYTIDPTGGNAIYLSSGFGIASHFYYLTSEEKHALYYGGGYQRYGYPDIQPITDYDYFRSAYFDLEKGKTTTNDLVMESFAEWVAYFTYAQSLPTDANYPHLSCEVRIDFDVGSDIEDELEAALTSSGWVSSWQGTYDFNESDGRFIAYLR